MLIEIKLTTEDVRKAIADYVGNKFPNLNFDDEKFIKFFAETSIYRQNKRVKCVNAHIDGYTA